MPGKIKSIVAGIVAFLLLATVLAVVFLKYQQHSSYQTLIPKDTRLLVKVDVYKLLRSSWSELRDMKRRDGKMSPSGISIPANVFAWNSSHGGSSSAYVSLPLKDSSDFVHWLEGRGLVKNEQGVWQGSDGYFSVVNSQHTAILCFDLKKQDHSGQLKEMLEGVNMVPVLVSRFKNISEQDGDICFKTEGLKGALNFLKGKATLYATKGNAEENPAALPFSVSLEKGQAARILFHGEVSALLDQPVYSIDSFLIHRDSLKAFAMKGFQLCLSQPVLQKDSVVTYEYDDNFEKVAVASVTEKQAPGIGIYFFAEQSLYQYLKRANVINEQDYIASSLFPLSPLKADYEDGVLALANNKSYQVQPLRNSDNLFEMQVLFDELAQQPVIGTFKNLWKPFSSFTARGTMQNGAPVYYAELSFKQANRSALLQLLEAW